VHQVLELLVTCTWFN